MRATLCHTSFMGRVHSNSPCSFASVVEDKAFNKSILGARRAPRLLVNNDVGLPTPGSSLQGPYPYPQPSGHGKISPVPKGRSNVSNKKSCESSQKLSLGRWPKSSAFGAQAKAATLRINLPQKHLALGATFLGEPRRVCGNICCVFHICCFDICLIMQI